MVLRGRNNWTPWIAGNIFGAACHLERPADELAQVAWRGLESCEKWSHTYGDDGGCDEGVMYWGVAMGALIMFLEHLNERSNGGFDLYEHPKLRAMARYPVTADLGGRCFASFSDTRPIPACGSRDCIVLVSALVSRRCPVWL